MFFKSNGGIFVKFQVYLHLMEFFKVKKGCSIVYSSFGGGVGHGLKSKPTDVIFDYLKKINAPQKEKIQGA